MRHSAVRLALGLVAFILVGWAAGVLLIRAAGSSDLDVVRDIAVERSPQLTAAARAVTWAGSAIVLVPLAAVCCLLLLREGLRREAVAVALSLAGAVVIYDAVKFLVSRPRPPVQHLQAVGGWSFPSGHATQAAALWASLVLVLPAVGCTPAVARVAAGLALALVIAVALSRVYLGVHYPGDVAAGLLLGTGWAMFVARCTRRRA
ncbi:MAG TPA: phosphatase PAP2 family protein [Solirubrobacteraceae bacterium]